MNMLDENHVIFYLHLKLQSFAKNVTQKSKELGKVQRMKVKDFDWNSNSGQTKKKRFPIQF